MDDNSFNFHLCTPLLPFQSCNNFTLVNYHMTNNHDKTTYKTRPRMFIHLSKTLLLWKGSKALKDIVQVDNKWCIPTPKSPDCNQISNLKRSASWIGSEFQDIGCLEFQSRNTRNVSRKGKKMTRKNSLIVRKKD